MSRTIQEELVSFVSDMYSVELQALSQLTTAPDLAGDESIAAAFRRHHAETEQQAEAMRSRLEALGEKPSAIKDAIMKLGGKSFLLFAKLQPETPGKLLVHAYSYEAMEWAGYEELAVLAGRANDVLTVDAAKAIAAQERAMMTRIEGLFDAAERASHEDTDAHDMPSHLRAHLEEEHALCAQNLKLIEKGEGMAIAPALGNVYRRNRTATEKQMHEIERQLHMLGGSKSALKDGALKMGALEWGMFFKSQSDTPAKLAAFAYAVQHLLIGGSEMLLRTARRANDVHVERMCDTFITQQRTMARDIADHFDDAVQSTLKAVA